MREPSFQQPIVPVQPPSAPVEEMTGYTVPPPSIMAPPSYEEGSVFISLFRSLDKKG